MTASDWTTESADEVAPGVFRIPLPLPGDALRAVNVYALVGGDGVTLIDSGWDTDAALEQLARGLRATGHGLSDVVRVLVTHVHRDHYEMSLRLRSGFGSVVGLGTGEEPVLDELHSPGFVPLAPQLVSLRLCGAEPLARTVEDSLLAEFVHDPATWAYPDEWLTNGQKIDLDEHRLDVVATPGHTPGHVVFYEWPHEVLFAGDHVLSTITPSLGFTAQLSSTVLADYLHSLSLIRSRPDAILLPAHGPTLESAHARVDQLMEHHRTRLDEVGGVVRDLDQATAYEVAHRIRWTRRERRLEELDVFNQMLAVLETEAHLAVLRARDLVGLLPGAGTHTYIAG